MERSVFLMFMELGFGWLLWCVLGFEFTGVKGLGIASETAGHDQEKGSEADKREGWGFREG